MPRFNITLTISAGSPICVGGSTYATQGGTPQTTAVAPTAGKPALYAPVWVNPLSIQASVGNAGVIYIMDGISYRVVPSASVSGCLTATLGAGTSTQPGSQYNDSGRLIDLNQLWIDGDSSGDTVTIAANLGGGALGG
jgi:hypothetical protein